MTVALSYFMVIQPNLIDIQTNNTTTGALPTTGMVIGTVSFTPSLSTIQNSSLDATVFLNPIVGQFTADGDGLEMVDGTLGVQLVDNLGLGLADGALTYRVDYWTNQSQLLPSYLIAAPGDGSIINLNDPTTHLEI